VLRGNVLGRQAQGALRTSADQVLGHQGAAALAALFAQFGHENGLDYSTGRARLRATAIDGSPLSPVFIGIGAEGRVPDAASKELAMDHVLNDCWPTLAVAGPGMAGPSSARSAEEGASLSALWTELVSGLCKIEHTEFTQKTCTVIVTRGHRLCGAEGACLAARDTEILERALLEGVRKSVAVDFGLCPSSIAEILRRCFVFMGLSCWPSRIPFLLVMAAHAKHAPDAQRGAKLLLAQNQQFLRQSISVARPDNELAEWLSPAEYAVTRLLIEGKSYQEMAKLRDTSKRTVANQLASAFHRLGISGRAELLCLLAKRKLGTGPAITSAKPQLALTPDTVLGFARVAGQGGR
jgi:DNA-binding CsgD family transcriptional regulator